MHLSLALLLTAAETMRLDQTVDTMSAGFREHRSHLTTETVVWGAVGVVVVLLVIVGGVRGAQWLIRRMRSGPFWLFYSLCRAHKLSWSDRWLLWRLARHHRLADSARVFVEKGRFAAERLAPGLRLRAARLADLEGRLFAHATPETGVPALGLGSPLPKRPAEAAPPPRAAPRPPAAIPLDLGPGLISADWASLPTRLGPPEGEGVTR